MEMEVDQSGIQVNNNNNSGSTATSPQFLDNLARKHQLDNIISYYGDQNKQNHGRGFSSAAPFTESDINYLTRNVSNKFICHSKDPLRTLLEEFKESGESDDLWESRGDDLEHYFYRYNKKGDTKYAIRALHSHIAEILKKSRNSNSNINAIEVQPHTNQDLELLVLLRAAEKHKTSVQLPHELYSELPLYKIHPKVKSKMLDCLRDIDDYCSSDVDHMCRDDSDDDSNSEHSNSDYEDRECDCEPNPFRFSERIEEREAVGWDRVYQQESPLVKLILLSKEMAKVEDLKFPDQVELVKIIHKILSNVEIYPKKTVKSASDIFRELVDCLPHLSIESLVQDFEEPEKKKIFEILSWSMDAQSPFYTQNALYSRLFEPYLDNDVVLKLKKIKSRIHMR